MSAPKTDRNFELIKDRLLEGMSWRALAEKHEFKSHNTAKEIYYTFLPLYLAKYPKHKKIADEKG